MTKAKLKPLTGPYIPLMVEKGIRGEFINQDLGAWKLITNTWEILIKMKIYYV